MILLDVGPKISNSVSEIAGSLSGYHRQSLDFVWDSLSFDRIREVKRNSYSSEESARIAAGDARELNELAQDLPKRLARSSRPHLYELKRAYELLSGATSEEASTRKEETLTKLPFNHVPAMSAAIALSSPHVDPRMLESALSGPGFLERHLPAFFSGTREALERRRYRKALSACGVPTSAAELDVEKLTTVLKERATQYIAESEILAQRAQAEQKTEASLRKSLDAFSDRKREYQTTNRQREKEFDQQLSQIGDCYRLANMQEVMPDVTFLQARGVIEDAIRNGPESTINRPLNDLRDAVHYLERNTPSARALKFADMRRIMTMDDRHPSWTDELLDTLDASATVTPNPFADTSEWEQAYRWVRGERSPRTNTSL